MKYSRPFTRSGRDTMVCTRIVARNVSSARNGVRGHEYSFGESVNQSTYQPAFAGRRTIGWSIAETNREVGFEPNGRRNSSVANAPVATPVDALRQSSARGNLDSFLRLSGDFRAVFAKSYLRVMPFQG